MEKLVSDLKKIMAFKDTVEVVRILSLLLDDGVPGGIDLLPDIPEYHPDDLSVFEVLDRTFAVWFLPMLDRLKL